VTPSLGGPGAGCSVTRVRRLLAGELRGTPRERALEHLAGCTRCQASERELHLEAEALARALPFDRFAAGVAEHLARIDGRSARPRRLPKFIPLALAAAMFLGVGIPLVAHISERPGEGGLRVKGAPSLALYAEGQGGARLLDPGEKVPDGAHLRIALGPASFTEAVVVLLDRDGATLLYAGKARAGPLPGAFEWTGARRGLVVAVFSNAPIEPSDLVARLSREGVKGAAMPKAVVLTLDLERGSAQ